MVNKKLKKEIQALADDAVKIRRKTNCRKCDAIYAALDQHNIQHGPTRRDRYKAVNEEFRLRNVVRAQAKQNRVQRRQELAVLQPSLF